MSIVRQVPRLFIRGSLATQTMGNLTEEQQKEVTEVFNKAKAHPALAAHRAKMIAQLRNTIGADYSASEIGDQEFQIAVWKATVDLLFHHGFKFKCEACNSSKYTNKQGTQSTIDRVKMPCPNCDAVKIVNPGDLPLNAGDFISSDELQEISKDCKVQPVIASTIVPLPGVKKYSDPYKILNDDVQFRRFYGEYVWNYFRQQIRENSITTKYRKELICDRADLVLFREIVSLCNAHNIDHSYDKRIVSNNGWFTVMFKTYQTSPEFTAEYITISQRAKIFEIKIKITEQSVSVKETRGAEVINGIIRIPEHVIVGNASCISNDGNSFNSIEDQTVVDDNLELVDTSDVVDAIRNALPDGKCRDVFDIACQYGQAYRDYSSKYGDESQLRTNHLAEFLSISPRVVTAYRQQIKAICVAHDLVPISRPSRCRSAD